MADPAVIKKIKINTGVLKRMVKEHNSYVKEVESIKNKIAKMENEAQNDDDRYAIKKTGEVLQETAAMIGDTSRRCASYLNELKKMLEEYNLSEEIQEVIDASEQIKAAEAIVA
ncbi:unnamed protein product [Auanema sp. JU1783]|nr:unnamed protein product [Auanema sp. JU1783]